MRREGKMHGDQEYLHARDMLWITSNPDKRMSGCEPPQHGRLPQFALALQDELRQAIEQGHHSTRMLQSAMASLEQQLHQCGRAIEECGSSNSRAKHNEVERWKEECWTLAEEAQDLSVRYDKVKCDRKNLLEENAHLRKKLEQREKELAGWKEDCMFFAVKFMNWGPSLLKWGPALHHEFERRLLQRRKKDGSIIHDRKLKSDMVVGSSRSTFVDKPGAVVQAVHHRHPKDCNLDDRGASFSCTNELWSSRKRKCVSCSTAVSAAESAPSTDFHR